MSQRRIAYLLWLVVSLTALPAAAEMETPFPMPMTPQRYGLVSFEQFEYQGLDGDQLRWDLFARYGGDYHRAWFRSEGEHAIGDDEGEAEAQLAYSRLVAPFWEAQIGLRYVRHRGNGHDRGRAQVALTLQGMAPYRFDTTAALFIGGPDGAGARLTMTRDLLLTQRWLLRARAEIEGALGDDRAAAGASGLRALEFGARLHFQVRRELMPYVGFSYERALGNTADRAADRAGERDDARVVFGISAWF